MVLPMAFAKSALTASGMNGLKVLTEGLPLILPKRRQLVFRSTKYRQTTRPVNCVKSGPWLRVKLLPTTFNKRRGNLDLGDALRAMFLGSDNEWDLKLPRSMSSFRAMPHSNMVDTE